MCRGTRVGERGRGRSKSASRIGSDDDLSVAWVRALLRGEARIRTRRPVPGLLALLALAALAGSGV
jgi:hypothetical protein